MTTGLQHLLCIAGRWGDALEGGCAGRYPDYSGGLLKRVSWGLKCKKPGQTGV